ncbi:MAG TPA: DUF4231 domain-containing protein [Nitrososphaeraceae archaeon]|nr:DUF4231 domain-containing protein [Nitrososphaeraceae archaeon]
MIPSPIIIENPSLTTSPNPSLKYAWQVFAEYDEDAKRQQKDFSRLQIWILVLGVIATALALSQTYFVDFFKADTLQDNAISLAILILPITISILVAARNQFKFGNKWVLLRAGAEAMKREIFTYRMHALHYSNNQRGSLSREQVLANRTDAITRQLLQTEVNLSAIQPYNESAEKPIPPKMYGAAADDNGYSDLTPDDYIKIRIGDQINYYKGYYKGNNYYKGKIAQLDLRLRIFQWLIYITGGVGTFLAAVGFELWVALTIALVALFTTFLEYRQIQNTLIQYNQALTNLINLQNWWTALPADSKNKPENIDKLVDSAETILSSELTGWVQQMQSAMAKIYEQKPTAA